MNDENESSLEDPEPLAIGVCGAVSAFDASVVVLVLTTGSLELGPGTELDAVPGELRNGLAMSLEPVECISQ